MKASYNWLAEFVEIDVTPEKVARLLTNSGSEVEDIINPSESIKKIKAVRIEKIQETDNGNVVTFYDGRKNHHYPTSLKLIPEECYAFCFTSNRFLSAKEIGIGDSSDPLLLHQITPGMPLSTILDWDDKIFELEITPNRPDCLSHYGLARELSVLLDKPLKFPEFSFNETQDKIKNQIQLDVKSTEFCPRYACRVISSPRIGPSPLKIAGRLSALGIRPINNIVDATNLTMLELGHPLHAFDKDKITGNKIVVRTSKKGERILTLDGVERKLQSGLLLISSAKEAIAVAGVMGGEESGIDLTTNKIVLESAYFVPRIIRQAEQKLSLTSESSSRFSKGTDPNIIPLALNRVTYWIKQFAGGRVSDGMLDSQAYDFKPSIVRLRTEKLRSSLGAKVSWTNSKKFLKGLGIKEKNGDKKAAIFEIPTFRPDITREIDLVEEIGRIWGYQKLQPALKLQGNITNNTNSFFLIKRGIAKTLATFGFKEVVTPPFGSLEDFVNFEKKENIVDLINPVSNEYAYMRPSLLPSILKVVSHNHRHNNIDLKLFEIANTYHFNSTSYIQKESLVIALSGLQNPLNWLNNKDNVDIYYAKGIVDYLLKGIGIHNYLYEEPSKSPSQFTSNEYLDIYFPDYKIKGLIGRLDNNLSNKYKLKSPLYFIHLPFTEELFQRRITEYKSFSREPFVKRDLSIIVSDSLKVSSIIDQLYKGSDLIKKVILYDVYRGKELEKNKLSITFTLFYLREGYTLTDEEVNEVHQKITQKILSRFNAKLRK